MIVAGLTEVQAAGCDEKDSTEFNKLIVGTIAIAAGEADEADAAAGGQKKEVHPDYKEAAATGKFHAQGAVGQKWSKLPADDPKKMEHNAITCPKKRKIQGGMGKGILRVRPRGKNFY